LECIDLKETGKSQNGLHDEFWFGNFYWTVSFKCTVYNNTTPMPNKNNIDPANTDKTKKALVACPFLKRRGYCLKGHRCDFLHENVLPGTRGKTSLQKRGERSPPPNMPQCSNNQFFLFRSTQIIFPRFVSHGFIPCLSGFRTRMHLYICPHWQDPHHSCQ
jgi:hypothetical protein